MSSIHTRIGSRASRLALWQANWVAEKLRGFGASVEIVEITTHGDKERVGPIAGLGLQGVFTKEIQSAVLEGHVDIAVHSLKDLPTETVSGLKLAAVPPRENPADALVANQITSLAQLPTGAIVGTGSLRRHAQLKYLRPDIVIQGIRGNVDTRLRKLDEGKFDAIVLAAAGLQRLGWQSRIVELLEPPRMLPAPGQGALGLECRADDVPMNDLLSRLDDPQTRRASDAERAMLSQLHAGCSAPVGAWGRIENERLALDGLVADLDAKQVLRFSSSADLDEADALGMLVAAELLNQGAAEIIAAAS